MRFAWYSHNAQIYGRRKIQGILPSTFLPPSDSFRRLGARSPGSYASDLGVIPSQPNHTMKTASVIITEAPPCVRANGPHGGGYTKPSTKEALVADAAYALGYELYGQRPVRFIGPAWVKEELVKQGFEL